jgi:hypothetical protein
VSRGTPAKLADPSHSYYLFFLYMNMDPLTLDLSRLRLPSDSLPLAVSKRPRRPPRHRRGEWFLKGPIPGSWLGPAAALNARALRLALAIWFEAGVTGQRTIRLSAETLRRFCVPPDGCRKGLAQLTAAGLVSTTSRPGARPLITLENAHQ